MSGDLLNTTVPSTDSSISYTPTSVWGIDIGPGAIGGAAYFDNAFAAAFINYAASQPITGVEWWGYQRSDHGLASICFDCPATSTGGIRVDYLNTSTNGTESPRLLYSTYNLTYAIHNLTIANLFDTRTPPPTTSGSFGQMSIDRFVLFAPSTPPSSSGPSSSSPASTGSDSAAPTAGAGTSNSNNGSSSSHRNAGAIAGGVVGGIAALLIIFALLWFFFFRKRRQTGSPQDMNGGEHPFEAKDGSFVQPNPVTPFILGSAPQAPAHLMQPMPMTHAVQSIPMAAQVAPMAGVGYASGPSASSGPSEYGGASRPLPQRSETGTTMASVATVATARPVKGARNPAAEPVTRASEVTSPSLYPASSDYSGPTGQTVPPRREQDAGFLQGDELEEEEPETLPPDYHAATARPRQPDA